MKEIDFDYIVKFLRKRVDDGSPSHSEFSERRALWRKQADMLEKVRFQLLSRSATDTQQKLRWIWQDNVLAKTVAMLRGENEKAGSSR